MPFLFIENKQKKGECLGGNFTCFCLVKLNKILTFTLKQTYYFILKINHGRQQRTEI